MKKSITKVVGAIGCVTTIIAYYLAFIGIIKLLFK